MADITGRVQRKIAHHLTEGETVAASLLVEPRGTLGFGAIALAAAPGVARRRLERTAEETAIAAGGLAARFPTEATVIAVTGRRILAVPSNGIRFGDVALEVPLGSLFVRSMSWHGLGRRIELAFSDGSLVTVDAQPFQPISRFVETIGRMP